MAFVPGLSALWAVGKLTAVTEKALGKTKMTMCDKLFDFKNYTYRNLSQGNNPTA